MYKTVNIWNTKIILGTNLAKAIRSWSPVPCYGRKPCDVTIVVTTRTTCEAL